MGQVECHTLLWSMAVFREWFRYIPDWPKCCGIVNTCRRSVRFKWYPNLGFGKFCSKLSYYVMLLAYASKNVYYAHFITYIHLVAPHFQAKRAKLCVL